MKKKKTFFCITSYNELKYTKNAIPSMLKTIEYYKNKTGNDVISYVMDDCSTDGTFDYINDQTELTCFQNKTNKGLTSLWNKAYQLAKNSDCNYLVISNNDVKFSEDSLFFLIGAVTNNINNMAGAFSNSPGHVQKQHIKNIVKDYNPEDSEKNIDFISNLIEKKNLGIQKLNGFCMSFNMNFLKNNEFNKDNIFNTNSKYKIFDSEEEFIKRVNPKCVVAPTFVFHYKQVSVNKYRNNYKKQWYRL